MSDDEEFLRLAEKHNLGVKEGERFTSYLAFGTDTAHCVVAFAREIQALSCQRLVDNRGGLVPAGWKLVPTQPTIEMVMAGRKRIMADMRGPHMGPSAENAYESMLAAVPAIPAKDAKPFDIGKHQDNVIQKLLDHGTEVDERVLFEQYMTSEGNEPLWRQPKSDEYVYWESEWKVWQARAKIHDVSKSRLEEVLEKCELALKSCETVIAGSVIDDDMQSYNRILVQEALAAIEKLT